MSVLQKNSRIMLSIRTDERVKIANKARAYGLSVSRFMVIAALSFKPGYEPVNHEVPKQ